MELEQMLSPNRHFPASRVWQGQGDRPTSSPRPRITLVCGILCALGAVVSAERLLAQAPTNLILTADADRPRTISAQWQCAPNCGSRSQLAFGSTTVTQYRNPSVAGNPAGWYQDHIIGLAPSTKYYVLPIVYDAQNATASVLEAAQGLCPGGAAPLNSTYACEDTGNGLYAPVIWTAPDPATYPEPPYEPIRVVPDGMLFDEPFVNGLVLTTDTQCSDLQYRLNECHAYAQTHPWTTNAVEVRPGSTCVPHADDTPGFVAPSITATGARCILRSAAEPRLLPPPGSTMNPQYTHGAATIRGSSNYSRNTKHPVVKIGDNWTLGRGIIVRLPRPSEISQRSVAISSVVGNRVVASGHPYIGGEWVNIYAEGLREADWQEGQCWVASATSDAFNCYFNVAATGSFVRGFATDSPLRSIGQCSQSGVCSVPGHPYVNRTSHPIATWNGTDLSFGEDVSAIFRANSSLKLSNMTGKRAVTLSSALRKCSRIKW